MQYLGMSPPKQREMNTWKGKIPTKARTSSISMFMSTMIISTLMSITTGEMTTFGWLQLALWFTPWLMEPRLVPPSSVSDYKLLKYLVLVSGREGSENTGLGLLIFIAILLHKAPAAIGFGTFLHHEGVRKETLQLHLGAFTSTAPIATVLAYFALHIIET